MKRIRLNHWLFLVNIVLFFLPLLASAQDSSTAVKKNQEDRSDGSFSSLYASIGFANNMNYMGSNLSDDKPLFSGSLTYGFKEEFYASVSLNHLSAFDPLLAFSTFSLSYDHEFNSWLDISLSVSRYQVNSSLSDTLFNSFFYGSLTAGFDWKIIYTNISLGAAFSESGSTYLQIRNSRYFETPSFLKGKAFITFYPYVNLMLGTLTKTVTSEGTSIGVTPPFRTPKSGQGSGGTTTTYFGVMEVDLGIPVGFNMGNITIEAEPGYVLPAYSATDVTTPKGFTMFLNVYFRII